jgi:2-hydroxychromene-2-carboxylate isomerase
MERTARFHNIFYKAPSQFPIGTQVAARATLWVQQTQPAKAAVDLDQDLVQRLLHRRHRHQRARERAAHRRRLGIDRAALETALGTPELKEQLRQATEAAGKAGCSARP